MLPAIEQGFMQQEIGDAAFVHQRQVERGEQIIVGVNDYVDGKPPEIPILRMDPDGFRRQVGRLEKLRRERDNEKVSTALNALRTTARGTKNLMPYLLDAARAYATLQEMADVLRVEFGAYQEKHTF